MKEMCKNGDYRQHYEVVLSAASTQQNKYEAIMEILKLAATDDIHFSFLLNQIDWFCTSNKELIPLLNKIIRLYRGTSREASDGLTISDVNFLVVDVISICLSNIQDRATCFACLKDNYPHKVCPIQIHLNYQNSLLQLCKRVPSQRIQFLQMILQNLAYFDTEMALGEDYIEQYITEDEKIMALTEQCSDFENKFDALLANLLKHFTEYPPQQQKSLLKEVFVIFQKIIMLVGNTKMIQIAIFYLAQLSNQLSSSFVSLIIATILQNYGNKEGSQRKFISALQYLTSYICRSCRITAKKVRKIVNILVEQLKNKITSFEKISFSEINVCKFKEENYQTLQLLQSILVILAQFPQAKQSLKIQYGNLAEQCREKLVFEKFVCSQILDAHKIFHEKQNKNVCIEYTNKFMPIFLKQTQKMVKIKLKLTGKRLRKSETKDKHGLPLKRNCLNYSGNQTPITIGQNQLQGKL